MSRILLKKDIEKLFKPVKEYRKDKLIEILTELADYVSDVEQERANAVQKVKDFNKDEEIVKLKKQLEEKREKAKEHAPIAEEEREKPACQAARAAEESGQSQPAAFRTGRI